MKLRPLALTASLALVSFGSPGWAQTAQDQPTASDQMNGQSTTATSSPGQMDNAAPLSAANYLQMASSSDQFEIQSSQLAVQNSQNAGVRSFAQMLINDHTRMSNEMMAAAQAAGVATSPPVLAAHHAQMLTTLQTAGPNFDSVYRQQQITAHQEALNLHRSYASSGDVASLKSLATTAVPAIEMHLQQAQALPDAAPPAAPAMSGAQGELRRGERG
jgi:putative membrane protein